MSSNGARAWKALFDVLQSQKPWLAERLAEYDLTIFLGHTLHTIAEAGEMTMSGVAGALFVDASNATGLIDRLVARGLVERRPAEHDRRAKVVRLTAAGRRLEKRIDHQMMTDPPPAIARLSAADQRVLREILEKALALAAEEANAKSA
jgi:DNA-binding MarR family transcriptional regulator